jgi:hypothetical protein
MPVLTPIYVRVEGRLLWVIDGHMRLRWALIAHEVTVPMMDIHTRELWEQRLDALVWPETVDARGVLCLKRREGGDGEGETAQGLE